MNFDNIANGMLSLFVLSTQEGWPNYILNFIDASDDENSAPILNNNQFSAFFYFMVFLFVGSLFLLNLFIGILFINYKMAEE